MFTSFGVPEQIIRQVSNKFLWIAKCSVDHSIIFHSDRGETGRLPENLEGTNKKRKTPTKHDYHTANRNVRNNSFKGQEEYKCLIYNPQSILWKTMFALAISHDLKTSKRDNRIDALRALVRISILLLFHIQVPPCSKKIANICRLFNRSWETCR